MTLDKAGLRYLFEIDMLILPYAFAVVENPWVVVGYGCTHCQVEG